MGGIIKLSDNDEISLASDGADEEDTLAQGGNEGDKVSRGDEQNNKNESVWSQSGL